jgi:serine protease Do
MKRGYRLCLGWSLVFATGSYAYEIPAAKRKAAAPELQILQKISEGISSLAEDANKALVFISISKYVRSSSQDEIQPFNYYFNPKSEDEKKKEPIRKRGLGSGFFIDLQKGYIISNYHVVDGAHEIYLNLANGETYQGEVVGRDKKTDIAVIKVRDPRYSRAGLAALALGDSGDVQVGEFVLALGAPYGLQASLSFGILSATGRGTLRIIDLGNFLQTDAAINPGNSGGPLLNMEGQVIGMNTAIFSRSGSSAGIGFAVPANLIRDIATQLINNGKARRGYLGVKVQTLDPDIILGLGLPQSLTGVVVSDVEDRAPAKLAGILSGDIVTSINGKKITSSEELILTIGVTPPGSEVKLGIFKGGQTKSVPVRLAEFPSDEPQAPSKEVAWDDIGVELREVKDGFWEKRLRDKYGYKSKQGLLITSIDSQSIFDRAGLMEGDVIIKANNRALTDPGDLRELYEKSKQFVVLIERKGEFLYAPVAKD